MPKFKITKYNKKQTRAAKFAKNDTKNNSARKNDAQPPKINYERR